MIAIDTNILLQYVMPSDEKQARKARDLVDTHCSPSSPALVHFVCLAEFWWVLRKSRKVPKQAVLDVLEALFSNESLAFTDPEVLASALIAYREGAADFPDYLVFFDNRRHGAAKTFTFDKDAARADFMTQLI